MKKLLIFFVGIVLSLLVVNQAFAFDSSDTGWTIKEFNSTVNIQTSRTTEVTEEIKVDFKDLQKHGIFRYMPYEYNRNGNTYNVRVKIESIKDTNGIDVPFEKSQSFGNITLKIGDANKTISGEQTYKISYKLERVINSFSDHDEFYWNVTGNDWPVPIEKTSITINWPKEAQMTDNVCYIGIYGSTDKNCLVGLTEDQNYTVTFKSGRTLEPGEGMTIASGVKLGVIKNYPFWQGLVWFFSDNWPYLIPFLVLGYLLTNYYKNGRDPKGRETIVPEFSPPDDLRPAVLGTVYDEKVDTHDISAVIIDLAVRGYLKIKETATKGIFGEKKEYEFTDTGKNRKDLINYESEIMTGIFEGGKTAKLSDLKTKFYKHVPEIKKNLYDIVTQKKYFKENPNSTRLKYAGIGGGIIALSIFLPSCFAVFTSSFMPGIIACVVSGLLFIIFAGLMPKRTPEGVETTRKIKGFRLYIYTAERYREKFNERENIFEKFLPYAMVFGIVDKWAAAFKDMQLERPDWYEGQYGARFDPLLFAIAINSMGDTMNSALVTAPSSAGAGGSGFSGGGSGGGFGGGGGGSW